MSKFKDTSEIMENMADTMNAVNTVSTENENSRDLTAEAAAEPTADESAIIQDTEQNDPAERIRQLEEELHNALQAKDEYYNRLLRNQADFENFRRRSRQEYEQVLLCAGEDLLKKILPVVDNLERAVNSFVESSDNCSWQEGVQLILKQFKEILNSEGVEEVQSLNEAFDPLVHEAVLQEESETVAVPTVIMELQKGYKYKNKLLRPALVKVALPKGS